MFAAFLTRRHPVVLVLLGVLLAGVVGFAGISQALSWGQLKAKPFNILGQTGAIYKVKGKGQEFLTLKKMNGMIAANMFGNLNNQILVQQLAQQALNNSKKAKNVRLQLKSIQTVGKGTYPTPKALSPAQKTEFQHVRANFAAYDKSTNQLLKGKEAGRVLEVLVVRLSPGASAENVVTTYNMDGAVSKPQLNQFMQLLASHGGIK